MTTSLSSQQPTRAKESDSNHDVFRTTLQSPLTGKKEILIARYTKREKYNAYASSSYDYWDAKLIGMYFQQTTHASKLWIGNKFLFMSYNGAMNTINSTLNYARNQYFTTTSFNNLRTLRFYNDGFNYNDAILWRDFGIMAGV